MTALLDFSLVFPLDHFFFFCLPELLLPDYNRKGISGLFVGDGWMGRKGDGGMEVLPLLDALTGVNFRGF